jgi:Ser/Thr protein kinase RdoA (MazF antagonist)
MTRIPGVTFDQPEGVDQAREAGRLVASFHRALFDFDVALHPIGFPYHEISQHMEELSLAIRECGDHDFHSEIASLAEQIFQNAAELPLLRDVPRRVIHGDLKFNNLLFEPLGASAAARPIALIDLDTVSRMPLALDWGDALRSWCNRLSESEPEAELDLALVQAACEGLMSAFEVAPNKLELESLGWGLEIISLELSARFATDALRECYFAWDKEKYESAGAHNRDRARGQFDLFRQARDTHEERAGQLSI